MDRLIAAVRALLPNPPKPPMWTCSGCRAGNEDFRSNCRNCGASR